jgi:hypothetical protein
MSKIIKSSRKKTVTRRDFLKGAAFGTLGVALGLKHLDAFTTAGKKVAAFAADKPGSTAVLVRRADVIDADDNINGKIVGEMIDQAVLALTGEKDISKAWKHYLNPGDTVGIKVTRCNWMRIHTEQAVIDAINQRLADIAIPKGRVHVDDAGLPLDKCTALLNVPAVKVHTLTGIAASLKNYINFSSRPSAYHHAGSANLGEIWNFPKVKGKTRLIIIDFLRPYFGPGPQINPLHRWNYNGILVGTDPAAIDTICLSICQEKRNLFKGEEWLITPPATSITAADKKYGLGTGDPGKIKLTRIGWDKDILI